MERPQINTETLQKALEAFTIAVGQRIEEHGWGAYLSHHEFLGIVTEEYLELNEAVRSNDPVEVGGELMDVAVGAFWSIASMMEKENQLKAAQSELEQVLEETKSVLN
jgi:NTP pyrophosphatase (non-canonical NTP hydrolase)